jgi:hypothetical protein
MVTAMMAAEMRTADRASELADLRATVDDLQTLMADRDRRIIDLERALTLAADAIGSLVKLHAVEGVGARVEAGMFEIRERLGWPAA